MSKPSVLTLRVPASLKSRIAELATQQGVSLNQFAMYMLTTKVTELETAAFFENIVDEKSPNQIQAEFDAIMRKLKTSPNPSDTPDWDTIPEN